MRVAILGSSPLPLGRIFAATYCHVLAHSGISLPLVILDQRHERRLRPLRSAIRTARRQAKISGCSTITSALRLLTYRILVGNTDRKHPSSLLWPADVRVVQVPTLNCEQTTKAVQDSGCDVVCLMGAVMLSRDTLSKLPPTVINIHSSDPQLVHGGPVVVWEILQNCSDIILTLHRVTEQLDAGAILDQRSVPISFRNGLRSTTKATMAAAEPVVAAMFYDVLTKAAAGRLEERRSIPGPLRVTPSVRQLIEAERRCRRESLT